MFSNVSPVVDSTHSPSIKFLKMRDLPEDAGPAFEVNSEVAIEVLPP
jgi:hypothetical protein